jgi:hypothetical protein
MTRVSLCPLSEGGGRRSLIFRVRAFRSGRSASLRFAPLRGVILSAGDRISFSQELFDAHSREGEGRTMGNYLQIWIVRARRSASLTGRGRELEHRRNKRRRVYRNGKRNGMRTEQTGWRGVNRMSSAEFEGESGLEFTG